VSHETKQRYRTKQIWSDGHSIVSSLATGLHQRSAVRYIRSQHPPSIQVV